MGFFEGEYKEPDTTIEFVNRIPKGRGFTYEWKPDSEAIVQFEKLLDKLYEILEKTDHF